MQKGRTILKYLLIALSIVSICSHLPCFAESNNVEYPDIKWQPKSYTFDPGPAPRYIDFENGDDRNPGTKEKPWKHHPWDKAAKANASACRGVHTYCFKKGVVYRGSLVAKESGKPENAIFLTVDPSWGSGRASIYGSVQIKKGWTRCNDGECLEIPPEARMHTWYTDLDGSFVPRMLWEIHDDEPIRIPIARTPNWEIVNPDDPRSEWWELTGYVLEVTIYLDKTSGFKVGDRITGTRRLGKDNPKKVESFKGKNRITEVTKDHIKIDSWDWRWRVNEIKAGDYVTNKKTGSMVTKVSGAHDVISRLVDDNHLAQNDSAYWVGATMWAEKESMPKPDAEKVIGYDPQEHSLRINYHRGVNKGPRKYDRYYLENLAKFLDSPGEFFYAEDGKHAGRLYIRLPKDRNPNASIVEAARDHFAIDISNRSNITISGLDLRFLNAIDSGDIPAWHATLYASAIRLEGSCSNIRILNSEICHVPAGIVAYPEKRCDVLDYFEISDNYLHNIDGTAIGLTNGRSIHPLKDTGARLIHVNVLRNRIRNAGFRVVSHWGIGPHTVHIEGGELVEIAGNVIDTVWGAGILAFNGSDYSRGVVQRPLLRILIHHNKVINSLLGMQDYGGIASWMGGPSYVYCNISGNPVGYKHAHHRRLKRKDWYRTSCFGIGVYLDGQYKGYVFNNIVWGKNNNVNDRIYNACAFKEAMGFMNIVFNNTMYRFGVGFHKDLSQHSRCYYLGNLLLDIGHKFFKQENKPSVIEYDSLAYAKNVFQGCPTNFGQLGKDVFTTLDDWKETMGAKKVMVPETGCVNKEPQVLLPGAHDFRLKPDSIGINSGARVFVPWGLYAVVGEWGFFYHPADPTIVLGENMNWNDEWFHRQMYHDIPRNDMKAHNISKHSFKKGILEDWTKGTLELNGKNQYCDISDEVLRRGYQWSQRKCKTEPCSGYYDGKKRLTVDMGTNNFLIEVVFKAEQGFIDGGLVSKRAGRGYTLDIDENGYARLILNFGTSHCFRLSDRRINDGKWHHVIAEVDRTRPEGINIYVDGKASNGQWQGIMNNNGSLSNTANFTVGKNLGIEERFFKGSIDFLRISRGTLRDAETTIQELYQWEFDGPFLKDFYGRPATGRCRDAGALEYMLQE